MRRSTTHNGTMSREHGTYLCDQDQTAKKNCPERAFMIEDTLLFVPVSENRDVLLTIVMNDAQKRRARTDFALLEGAL